MARTRRKRLTRRYLGRIKTRAGYDELELVRHHKRDKRRARHRR